MKTGRKLRSGILCGMLALAGTALAVGWNASEAKADDVEVADSLSGLGVEITIDYDQQVMHIIEREIENKEYIRRGDAQFQVGFATYKKATKTKDEYLTVSSWELYDNVSPTNPNGVKIDLSRLKSTTDNYIEIKGNNNSNPIAIKFPKMENGTIASYNKKLGTVEVYSSAAAKKDGEDPLTEGVEYRTATGQWQKIDDLGNDPDNKVETSDNYLEKYQQGGATLYYRISAQYEDDTVTKTGVSLEVTDEADEEIGGIPLYTAGSFAGTEKKVTIPKLANGPKITVNYVTGELTLARGQEYREYNATLTQATDLAKAGFIMADEDLKKELVTLNLKDPFVIELRKAAVEEKSLASKVTQLVCAKQGITKANFYENYEYKTDRNFDIMNKVTNQNRLSVVTDDEDEDEIGSLQLYGEYIETTSKKGVTTKSYILHVYNNNKLYAYDFIAVSDHDTPAADVAAKQYTSVPKLAKTVKEKKITFTNADNMIVYARRQANTAEKSWRTEWAPIGKLVPKK